MLGLAIRQAGVAAVCTVLAVWSVVILHAWHWSVVLALVWASRLVMAGGCGHRVTLPAKLERLVTGFKLFRLYGCFSFLPDRGYLPVKMSFLRCMLNAKVLVRYMTCLSNGSP